MVEEKEEPSASPAVALSPEGKKKQNRRNLAIALVLAVFMALVFVVTILRIGGAGGGS